MKITQQKGYPDSNGKMHKLLVDAQKSEANIQLDAATGKAVSESEEGVIDIKDFITKNSSAVLEYIKYNCTKPKAAPKKKPAKPPVDK